LRALHLTPGGFRKIVVITNDWHMDRTRCIFEKVLNLPEKGHNFDAKLDRFFPDKRYELSFESVDSGIADESILKARVDREKQSLHSFETNLADKWDSFQELHDWLFTKHDAYSSKRLLKPRSIDINDALLKSY
jgi:hypothetical protein